MQERSLGYARDDDGAKRYQNSAALLIFMRRTTPAEPSEPIEPAPPLSQTIKGQHPPNLEGRDWGYGTLPPEQPLREGARQRRRMDPRGGLKTNVKLSIPHACHFERSREILLALCSSLPLSRKASNFTLSHIRRYTGVQERSRASLGMTIQE